MRFWLDMNARRASGRASTGMIVRLDAGMAVKHYQELIAWQLADQFKAKSFAC